MSKITRVRTGCWTCKKRHRKCDEGKPSCNNCISTNRTCEGYKRKLLFDTDGFMGKDYGAARKPKVAKKNDPFVHEASFSTKSTPMVASLTSIESVESSLGVRAHTPQSMSSVATTNAKLEEESQTREGPEMDIPPVVNETTLIDSLCHDFDIDKMAKSPFTQAFGDLFSGPKDSGKSLKTPQNHDLALLIDAETPRDGHLETYSNFDTELLQLIGKTHVFDDSSSSVPKQTSLAMSYQEENRMLKHFFQDLLPLLDAHPQSPWPALALRYCDFDVARSCFISLACIHIYESRKGGNEYYDKGMAHIHSTMTHLIESISSSSPSNSPENAETSDKTRIQSFVILVLVNVHILYAVLENGKSSLARYLFKVFGSICQNNDFYRSLMSNESKGSLVVVFSWYDTVSAMASPDCRLPYCSPDWYGSYQDVISTSKMMGCPGEIFRALSEICFLRHEIHEGNLEDDEGFEAAEETVKGSLINYRDYVDFRDGSDYTLRLKGAQCWSLAVYISLLRLFKTPERAISIQAAVNEFIEVYGSMPSDSPVVTQMVWPVYAVGCECLTAFEREKLSCFMDTLYETAQMGTLASLRWVVNQVWQRGVTQEEILREWLEEGMDYLPL